MKGIGFGWCRIKMEIQTVREGKGYDDEDEARRQRVNVSMTFREMEY